MRALSHGSAVAVGVCKNAIIAQKSIAGALENRAPNSGFNLLDENGDLNGAHLPP
jgi:hypothetical protein